MWALSLHLSQNKQCSLSTPLALNVFNRVNLLAYVMAMEKEVFEGRNLWGHDSVCGQCGSFTAMWAGNVVIVAVWQMTYPMCSHCLHALLWTWSTKIVISFLSLTQSCTCACMSTHTRTHAQRERESYFMALIHTFHSVMLGNRTDRHLFKRQLLMNTAIISRYAALGKSCKLWFCSRCCLPIKCHRIGLKAAGLCGDCGARTLLSLSDWHSRGQIGDMTGAAIVYWGTRVNAIMPPE